MPRQLNPNEQDQLDRMVGGLHFVALGSITISMSISKVTP